MEMMCGFGAAASAAATTAAAVTPNVITVVSQRALI
jgi:hypothetical protein